MLSGSPVLVTGATGTVGGALLSLLADRGREVIAGVTDPATFAGTEQCRAVDFNDPDTFWPALAGVGQVFLMRPPAISDTKRYLRPFIQAAREQQVTHVVFLSVMGVNRFLPHWQVEQDLKASTIPFTMLRPSFFAQNLQTAYREQIRDESRIVASSRSGRTSFIDVRDIAAVAALVLADPTPHVGQAYTLTGPAAYDFYRVASMLSAELGRTVVYEPQRLLQYRATLRGQQLPPAYVNVQLVINLIARIGLAAKVTRTVPELLGRSVTSLGDYLHDNRGAWTTNVGPQVTFDPGPDRPQAATLGKAEHRE